MGRLLDLSAVHSTHELHDLLASFFGFPHYYGKNWDAFDECLADFAPATTVVVRGFQNLLGALPRDADALKEALGRAATEDPAFTVIYE